MTHRPETAYIALGANLADPVEQVRRAIAALATLPQTELVRVSSLYRTAPVGVRGHPDFINAVARIDTRLGPEALLAALLAIEARFGRRRDQPLSPRTLDLDLLLYADLECVQAGPPELLVPHPRMHLRAFVLVPLLEIAPQATIPGRGRAAAWQPAVASQKLERLP